MAVSHKGAISFGLVHIPVALYAATYDNDLHFNQLCKKDGGRIKYKKVCSVCGNEMLQKDIVKGYEYQSGKYVTVTNNDFEKAKTEKDKTIYIMHFTDLKNIPTVYFEKTYHALPEKGGEKAFELLRKAMQEKNKAAVAKTVLGSKERLLALVATDDGIYAQTLFFEEELKNAPGEAQKSKTLKQEVDMAKTLIAAMDKPFKPSEYKDEYRERMLDIINSKIKGKTFIISPDEVEFSVGTLMDALKESVSKAKK